jgi:hypothetical protein
LAIFPLLIACMMMLFIVGHSERKIFEGIWGVEAQENVRKINYFHL